ncbi:hypothetical protein FIE12Z_10513 [Fusarium flagelliforme]|uniref:BTB domain-containing protein n=1 Tax=Fusarium flagelliforme TaxID=2675880 RepID=A0A395MBE3_9HYPO|nr:hypothetical protein FIE12Z_10513 [Fusarium flagelliforme]
MVTMYEVAAGLQNTTPDAVERKVAHLCAQRANHLTDFALIGRPNEAGVATTYPVHRWVISARSSFLRDVCQRTPQSPHSVPAYSMDFENREIECFIDFMYYGVYGLRPIASDSGEPGNPDLRTHVCMYMMGVRFDVESLRRFALRAIQLNYPIADRQDVVRSINDV